MKRMLIFGARGFVGGCLAAAARPLFEVIPSDGNGRVNLTERAACRRLFDSVRPDVVCLLAAISDIDRCEREPRLAHAVNVHGTENIARECLRTGARLLFTSSGAVFDGTSVSYVESDRPSPVSVYGRTKARAERIVAAILPNAVIVRLSLVLGRAPHAGTNALVDKLLASWDAGRAVTVPVHEYRNAIDVSTLADFILELVVNEKPAGIYHVGSSNALSRFEIARRLALAFGYSADLIAPQTHAPVGRAPRGLHEFLRTDKLAAICRAPIPTCEEAIERCAHATAQSHS
jgi:dTDP-4-dehydrorhamnose reductase